MEYDSRAFALSPSLRLCVRVMLVVWMVLAAFPLLWILVMSFKLPVDAFAPNPLSVVFGPSTREAVGGISVLDLGVLFGVGYYLWRFAPKLWREPPFAAQMPVMMRRAGLVIAGAIILAALPLLVGAVEQGLGGLPLLGWFAEPLAGMTFQHYRAVWVEDAFYREFTNSAIVTAGVVCLSLSIGAPAGYALARGRTQAAFWILVIALIFRALPHSVLITGYL